MKTNFELFVTAIPQSFVAQAIAECNTLSDVGGIGLFIGQVRADLRDNQRVSAIEFTAYAEMAREQARKMMGELAEKFGLKSLSIAHSLGNVKVGEVCFVVCTASKHRKNALDACQETVERVKKELPLWGKEILENHETLWKTNN